MQAGERSGEWLIVDGYNIIGAWEELSQLAEHELSSARDALRDVLVNHCSYTGQVLVLVFDAHQTLDRGRQYSINNKDGTKEIGVVVYTKKAETADNYIERFVRDHTGERMSVASNDSLVQVMIFAHAARLSARDLSRDVEQVGKEMKALLDAQKRKHALEERLSADTYGEMDRLRRSEQNLKAKRKNQQ